MQKIPRGRHCHQSRLFCPFFWADADTGNNCNRFNDQPEDDEKTDRPLRLPECEKLYPKGAYVRCEPIK